MIAKNKGVHKFLSRDSHRSHGSSRGCAENLYNALEALHELGIALHEYCPYGEDPTAERHQIPALSYPGALS